MSKMEENLKQETIDQLLKEGMTEEEIRVLAKYGTLTEQAAQEALGNPFRIKVLKGLANMNGSRQE